MPVNPLYANEDGDGFVQWKASKNQLPLISEKLDSVRAYQWEIHFFDIPGLGDTQDLTLAAKQVSQTGFQVEDIEVNRINDKVFYPGKPTPDELVVTFDNLLKDKVGVRLWNWFTNIYDPESGEMTKNVDYQGAGTVGSRFKAQRVEVVELDNRIRPIAVTQLFGVYPKAWKAAERNYSVNEFHTIEVTFRYDFLKQVDYNLI